MSELAKEPTLFYLITNEAANSEKFRATACFNIGVLLENSDTITKWKGMLETIIEKEPVSPSLGQ